MPNYCTIEGFENLTEQQIFDMAVTHIGTTGVKSATITGQCKYSGSGCNAAPLLQVHRRHDADMVGAWMELVEDGKAPAENALFITQLQDAHDSSGETSKDYDKFRSDYLMHMNELAASHKLNKSKLVELSLKWERA